MIQTTRAPSKGVWGPFGLIQGRFRVGMILQVLEPGHQQMRTRNRLNLGLSEALFGGAVWVDPLLICMVQPGISPTSNIPQLDVCSSLYIPGLNASHRCWCSRLVLMQSLEEVSMPTDLKNPCTPCKSSLLPFRLTPPMLYFSRRGLRGTISKL